MKWSEKTWDAALPVYKAITEMPFVRELAAGTLPHEKFIFYIGQDDIYLRHYSQTLAMIAARTATAGESLTFTRFAESALLVEREMHEGFYRDGTLLPAGTTLLPAAAEHIEPACHHYVSFLKSTAALDPVEVAMAAVLPCFWIYREVGRQIYAAATAGNATADNSSDAPGNTPPSSNPYQSWIDTYVAEEFSAQVDCAIELCDAAAARCTPAQQQAMTDAFVTAARLEFDFWDAAYRLRIW